MKKTMGLLLLLLVGVLLSAGVVVEEAKQEGASEKSERQANIDAMAAETLDHLFAESPHATKLYGNVGYRIIEANIQELLADGGDRASWC
jgi:hypothetical protein